jgi:hypothetical protein
VHTDGQEETADATPHTEHGKIMGTPYYISPEAIQGKPVDERSEIYACGIMMYEMLTGSVPFRDRSVKGLFRKHLFDIPPPIAEIAPEVSLDVANLTYRAIEKKPSNRYTNMGKLVEALSGIQQGWRMAGELEERKRLSIEMAKVLTSTTRVEPRRHSARRMVTTGILLVALVAALVWVGRWIVALDEIGVLPDASWSRGHPASTFGEIGAVRPPAPDEARYRLMVQDPILASTIRVRVRASAFDAGDAAYAIRGASVLLKGVVDVDPEGVEFLRVDAAASVRLNLPFTITDRADGTPLLKFAQLEEGRTVDLTGIVVRIEKKEGRVHLLVGETKDRILRVVRTSRNAPDGRVLEVGDEIEVSGKLARGGDVPAVWRVLTKEEDLKLYRR